MAFKRAIVAAHRLMVNLWLPRPVHAACALVAAIVDVPRARTVRFELVERTHWWTGRHWWKGRRWWEGDLSTSGQSVTTGSSAQHGSVRNGKLESNVIVIWRHVLEMVEKASSLGSLSRLLQVRAIQMRLARVT